MVTKLQNKSNQLLFVNHRTYIFTAFKFSNKYQQIDSHTTTNFLCSEIMRCGFA